MRCHDPAGPTQIVGLPPLSDKTYDSLAGHMKTIYAGYLQRAEAETTVRQERPVLVSVWVPAPAAWINSNTRIHRMQAAKLAAAWRSVAAEMVPDVSPFAYTVRIIAHIWKPRRGRYDPNNLNPTTKACVDGFVDAGILVDDDWNHVHGPDHRHGGIGPAGIVFEFVRP